MNKLLLIPLLIVLTLFTTVANTHDLGETPTITVPEEIFYENQEIDLTIHKETKNYEDLAIRITGPVVARNSKLSETVTYTPQRTGTYTVILYNSQTADVYDEKELIVEEQPEVQALDTAAFSNRFITLEKEQYSLDEIVDITINYKSPDFSLRLITPNSVFNFLGEPTRDIRFQPREEGKHELQLIAEAGVIERKVFTVTAVDIREPKNLPNTNIKNKIANSRGEFIDNEQITVKKDNVTIQSNIQRGQRYKVHIDPRDQWVEEVVFDDVQFGSELDVGMESLAPKYSPPEGASVAAFAIDPSRVDFTKGTIRVRAPADKIYKCKDYNFTTQECFGEHILIMEVTKGDMVEIPIDPVDPLFTFVDSSISCSCADSATGNTGSLSCNVYCPVTIDAPGSSADTGFIEEIEYVVQLTVNADGTTMSNANNEGDFDHDQTQGNGNEQNIGSNAATTTQTITWTATNLPESGSDSFNSLDCDNWPTDCSNYYAYLASSMDFSAPGKSTKSPDIDISLTSIEVVWNYTEAGDLQVTLNEPTIGSSYSSRTVPFNYSAVTTATSITSCALYTNESGWSQVNSTTTVANNASQILSHTYGTDGDYIWNVRCEDSDSNVDWGGSNFTITTDTEAPQVNLESPANLSVEPSSAVTLQYNVSDSLSSVDSCSAYINNSLEAIDSSITQGTTQEFVISKSNGDYSWYVSCDDAAGNTGTSETRIFTINTTPILYDGQWYESSTFNCNATGSCEISLESETDGTINTRTLDLPGGDSVTSLVNATTDLFGFNGVYAPSGQTVTFRADFSAYTNGQPYVTWRAFNLHNNGTKEEFCSFGNDDATGSRIQAAGFEEGTCTLNQDVTFSGTDSLRLEVTVFNDHPNQVSTITHDWDDANSYIDIPSFFTIGSLSTDLVTPSTNISLSQGDTFSMVCNNTCQNGYCLETNTYVEYRPLGSSDWVNISGSGNLTLTAGEVNPQGPNNITGNLTNTVSETYNITATEAGTSEIRCTAQSLHDSSVSPTIRQVTAGDAVPPVVELVSPAEGTFYNTQEVTFTYNVTDVGGLNSCSIYLDGSLNQTNSSVSTSGEYTFDISGITEGDHNWTVGCTDTSSLSANASETRNFSIDLTAPSIVLNYPPNITEIAFNTVTFNWTASDNRAENLTCDLYLDGSIENSGITTEPGIPATSEVSGISVGEHNWSVSCQDLATNTETSETRLFNITDNPPEVTLLSPGNNNYTSNTTIDFSYLPVDNNELLQCDLYFDGSFNRTNSSPIINNATNTFTLPGVTQGLHNWTVNCSDGSFTDQAPYWNFTVDTQNPGVFLVNPIDTEISSASATFEFNYTDNISPSGTCDLQYNSSVVSTTVTGINALNNALTSQTENGLLDGEYSWNVTCADLAQNTAASPLESFNISSIPAVTLEDPAANAYENGESVNFTFTASDNDGFANCSVRLLTGPNVSDTINSTPITNGATNGIVLNNLDSGSHTWTVSCVDDGIFQNTFEPSARFLFIDNIDPNITLNFPVDEEVTESTVNFNWTADDDQDLTLSCDLFVNGVLNQSSISSSAGTPTNISIPGFSNGQYNWSVSCSDDASNANTSITADFNVSVPPSVELTDPANASFINFTQEFTYGYTPSANADLDTCTLYVDGVANETETNPQLDTNQFFFINYSLSDEGFHEWNVLCTDVDGLSSFAPENFTYTLDFTGPNTTLFSPINNVTVNTNNVSFEFMPDDNFSPNVTCNLTVNGAPEDENFVATSGQNYTSNALLIDGFYEWNVTCRDLAGNFNTTQTENFTIFAPPNVTLQDPLDAEPLNESDVTLTYLPEDAFPIVECNLSVNGAFNQSDSSISSNQNNTFALNNLDEGFYNWSVACLDQDDNVASSDTFNFSVDLNAPEVTLYDPANQTQFAVSIVDFNFTANDTVDRNVTCDLIIDSATNMSAISVIDAQPTIRTVNGFADGVHDWNVRCIDDVNRENTSETRNFNTSVLPNMTLNAPLNNSWTNLENIGFLFNVSDNDGLAQCQLQVDSQPSTINTSITNNQENIIYNNTLDEQSYNWSVACTDTGVYANEFTPEPYVVNIDRTATNITLYDPADGANIGSFVTFNYSIIEESSPSANCSIILDGTNITFDTLTNGSFLDYSETVPDGVHFWNVTCTDFANNIGFSETRNFSIVPPNLEITSEDITFSDVNPQEGEEVVIFANVENIGLGDAGSFNVSFFLEDPAQGGSQIGQNLTITSLSAGANQTLNISYNATMGDNNIYVRVDTPISTNGTIVESDETDNEANRTLQVGHYEILSGDTIDELTVDDSSLTSLFRWAVENATGGNIFASDADSTIDFTNLTAISRTRAGVYEADDFEELDTILGSSNYTDSINLTYTSTGAPKETKDYRIFQSTISDVPIVNSTNSTSFKTGILWDSSDGGSSYNGSQDVVFVTQINESQTGFNGTYDYELKIPATLRDYIPGGGTVSLYAEVN